MKLPHLIYGTFPDLPGSQQVVFRSASISEKIQNSLINFYNDFGDCKNEEFRSSISVIWLEDENARKVAVVTKVTHSGKDFSGRWGALLRHSVILESEQFRRFFFDPTPLRPLLVESGTSAELSQLSEIELEVPLSIESYLDGQPSIILDNYTENLTKIFNGERLTLYAETNNELSDRYIANLVGLLPVDLRENFSWTEFVFKPSDIFDISLAYSSRYEAPAGEKLLFNATGENSLTKCKPESGFIRKYLEEIETAYAKNDMEHLARVLTVPISQFEVDSTSADT